MATVIAYDDAKVNQRRRQSKHNGYFNINTPFLGQRDNPDLPLVGLTQFSPGRVSTVHYHDVPQFQIMIGGKGKMGRQDIAANSVHFSRAYTPYGPFISDPGVGLTCLIIRSRPDSGAMHDPDDVARLRDMPNRKPWQITCDVRMPETGSGDVALESVPMLNDDNGLITCGLQMKPGATMLTPDPSRGDGLFVVVLKGSLIHEGKEASALTLVHITNREPAFEIRAGSAGLEGLIVQFPREPLQSAVALKKAEPGMKTWQCTLCAFAYDEAAGLPEDGIAPGTRWEDVPESWTCPDCAADKSGFEPTD
jgi:rubredoxin